MIHCLVRSLQDVILLFLIASVVLVVCTQLVGVGSASVVALYVQTHPLHALHGERIGAVQHIWFAKGLHWL